LGSFNAFFIAGPLADNANCPPPFGPSMDDPILMPNLPPQQMRPISLQEGINSTMKQNLNKKWATLFYEANIPFNVACHPYFIDAMKSTFEGKILYELLLYHLIQT
jgi:hypothetical protein